MVFSWFSWCYRPFHLPFLYHYFFPSSSPSVSSSVVAISSASCFGFVKILSQQILLAFEIFWRGDIEFSEDFFLSGV